MITKFTFSSRSLFAGTNSCRNNMLTLSVGTPFRGCVGTPPYLVNPSSSPRTAVTGLLFSTASPLTPTASAYMSTSGPTESAPAAAVADTDHGHMCGRKKFYSRYVF